MIEMQTLKTCQIIIKKANTISLMRVAWPVLQAIRFDAYEVFGFMTKLVNIQ